MEELKDVLIHGINVYAAINLIIFIPSFILFFWFFIKVVRKI